MIDLSGLKPLVRIECTSRTGIVYWLFSSVFGAYEVFEDQYLALTYLKHHGDKACT